ncbi:MAG TPA: hypothetical protein ENK57_09000 [Polyangiaceae bacterium]|nr:hypothetical protein [Polyangiaceae bacterium]
MPNFAPKIFSLLAFGAITAAMLPSCVENNSSIFIHSVDFLAPGECGCTGDPEDEALLTGTLDIRQRPGPYIAAVRIGNQMIRSADDARLRVETSHVTFYEAEVEVFDQGGGVVTSFSQPITSFAFAGNSTNPGFGCTFLTLIDAPSVANIATPQTVVARIKVFGETLGGNDVETGVFDFPIQVCDGCIGCIEPDPMDCDGEIPTEAAACNVGQDYAADCRCVPSSDPANPGGNASINCPGFVQACR